MIPAELPAWMVALGGFVPTAAWGIWQAVKWWRESETAEAKADREERERREDRAKAASEQIWREVQRELDRAYRRIDELERESAWWEMQARVQQGAAWEMRGAAVDARQAYVSLRARTGQGEDIPEAWRKAIDLPRIENPPRPLNAGPQAPSAPA